MIWRSALSLAFLAGISAAANVGPAAIGLTAFTQADTTELANIVAAENKDTDIAFLPFEFSNSSRGPFDRASELVRSALPRMSTDDTFRMTVYLNWTDDHNLGWADFRRAGDNATKQSLRNRAAQTGAWINAMRSWNAGRADRASRPGGQLKFTVVVQLEDNCADPAGYAASQQIVRDALSGAGVSPSTVSFRRSLSVSFAVSGGRLQVASGSRARLFRPSGTAIELHGDATEIAAIESAGGIGFGASGDAYTNDGETAMSLSDFRSLKSSLSARGINCLWWSGAYNGDRSQNRRDRVLRPFTGPSGANERSLLRNAM